MNVQLLRAASLPVDTENETIFADRSSMRVATCVKPLRSGEKIPERLFF
jgi:hypothetical protein